GTCDHPHPGRLESFDQVVHGRTRYRGEQIGPRVARQVVAAQFAEARPVPFGRDGAVVEVNVAGRSQQGQEFGQWHAQLFGQLGCDVVAVDHDATNVEDT